MALTPAKGFTLIELIILLLIAVLGFAVVGIQIGSGNQSAKLQAASRELASALLFAHSQALLNRKPVSVDINLGDNSYKISNRDKIYYFDSAIDLSVEVAEEEFSEQQTAGIRFFGDGSSTGGRVTLEWGQQSHRVDVNWITGETVIDHETG